MYGQFVEFSINVEHVDVIRNNYTKLLDQIDVKFSGILQMLFCKEVLNAVEMDTIQSETTQCGQNERLLSVLSRKSYQLFLKFVETLDETGQSHVADLIRNCIGEHDNIAINNYNNFLTFLNSQT